MIIQAIGNAPQKLSAYLRTYTGNVHTQVVSVDEDDETADALRTIKDKIDVCKYMKRIYKGKKRVLTDRLNIERFYCCSLRSHY